MASSLGVLRAGPKCGALPDRTPATYNSIMQCERTSAAFRHAAVIAVMTDRVAKQDGAAEMGLIWFVSDGLLCQQGMLIRENAISATFPV